MDIYRISQINMIPLKEWRNNLSNKLNKILILYDLMFQLSWYKSPEFTIDTPLQKWGFKKCLRIPPLQN